MQRKLNTANIFKLSMGLNILLVIALIAIVIGNVAAKAGEPEIIVDGNDVMAYANDFDVSIEYLQLILKDYLVYTVGGELQFQKLDPAIKKHGYDMSALEYAENGRIYYEDDDYPDICYGVDVSQYQGDIDWQAVAADNIDFAMLRVGFRGYGSGRLLPDEKFADNIAGASAAGLPVGVYLFSQAITIEEAEEEAQMVLEAIEGHKIEFPVVFDMEEIYNEAARTDILDKQTATNIAAAFCKKISRAGYQPMIYGNTKWLATRIDLAQLKEYPVWFAQYHSKPLLPYDFSMWQYSNSGSVNGIPTGVDMNICFKR